MKILEVCVDLDGGGIDRYLYNYCTGISGIRFDFAVVDMGRAGILEEPLTRMGCRIFRVPPLREGLKRNSDALKKIMTDGAYDAVHVHLGYKGFNALRCAKSCGIRTRIVHAHIADEPESVLRRFVRKICTALTVHYATDLVACGKKAAKWVWGEKRYAQGKVTVHSNAIDTGRFSFDPAVRARKRDELGVGDAFVIGHVGRICAQKNQNRMADMFREIKTRMPDAVLVLAGREDPEYGFSEKVKRMGLSDSVKVLGVRDDVAELLNAFDLFLFPSLFEGLPFTLVEAECNGVPVLCSDIITREIRIGENVRALPLSADDREWADAAQTLRDTGRAENAAEAIRAAGFDLAVRREELKAYYFSAVNGKGER